MSLDSSAREALQIYRKFKNTFYETFSKKDGPAHFEMQCDVVASKYTLCSHFVHSNASASHLNIVVRHTVFAVRRNCTTKSPQSITWDSLLIDSDILWGESMSLTTV